MNCRDLATWQGTTGIILCMRPVNERQPYNVTSSLIGWGHSQQWLLCDIYPIMYYFFFHTQLWFPASECDFRWFKSDFQCFYDLVSGKKYCGRNRIDHGRPSETELTLVRLYSTEITRYRSWFLEYKLTWVNSVPHRRPWWILYLLFWISIVATLQMI